MSLVPIGRRHDRTHTVSERVDMLREQLTPAVETALRNEYITRQRVDALEARWTEINAPGWPGFKARLRWLLKGR